MNDLLQATIDLTEKYSNEFCVKVDSAFKDEESH